MALSVEHRSGNRPWKRRGGERRGGVKPKKDAHVLSLNEEDETKRSVAASGEHKGTSPNGKGGAGRNPARGGKCVWVPGGDWARNSSPTTRWPKKWDFGLTQKGGRGGGVIKLTVTTHTQKRPMQGGKRLGEVCCK